MASAPQPAGSLRAVLQQPDFRKLWLAQFVSIFGDFLALFGFISLITFRWHGNALQVTLVMVAYMLPLALVGPLAGVFVDRWNVRLQQAGRGAAAGGGRTGGITWKSSTSRKSSRSFPSTGRPRSRAR